MDIDTFITELRRLQDELSRQDANLASFQCDGCLRCGSCMFCVDCLDCFRCTHCQGCVDCSSCSHCHGCRRCHHCAYCRESVRCQGSTYVVRSVDCVDCTYCYGCVGLIKREFHILNIRYPRKDYFEITAALDEAFALSASLAANANQTTSGGQPR